MVERGQFLCLPRLDPPGKQRLRHNELKGGLRDMDGNYRGSHMTSHKGPYSVSMVGTFPFRLHSWKLSNICLSLGTHSLDGLRNGSLRLNIAPLKWASF